MTAELVRAEVETETPCRYCGISSIPGEDICSQCFDYYDLSEPDYDDIDDGWLPGADEIGS